MILCVNPNAAIDKTVVVDNFQLGRIHRPREVLALPGGKGCNVARVLKVLGAQPMVTGWVGGHAGNYIEAGLQGEGIRTEFVHTALESRTCLSILDPVQGRISEIYENGVPIAPEEWDAFLALYRRLLADCEMVTLSGSLPSQVPKDTYARLIGLANQAGVPALLDSSGEALRLGVEGKPFLVKPNQDELSGLLGQDLPTVQAVARAARSLAARYQTRVVVSLGAQGALGVHAGTLCAWHAYPPALEIVSAVGSGDALLAGLAHALSRHAAFEAALRLGVAAGSANALVLGAGRVRLADIESIAEQVTLTRLDPDPAE